MVDAPSTPGPSRQCYKTPSVRKRRSRVGLSNDFSVKRPRLSGGPIDVAAEPGVKHVEDLTSEPKADRFISSRPDTIFPMDTTPRTTRIARAFGLIDDRILNYGDPPSTSAIEDETLSSIRRSASQLFKYTTPAHPSSAASVLGKRKQFILALDGPGIPSDPWAHPLAWSPHNLIAVACGADVYHQNLDTRTIEHLATFPRAEAGRIRALSFAGGEAPELLGLGTGSGGVHVYDAQAGKRLRAWQDDANSQAVGALAWRGRQLAVGRAGGGMAWLDSRAAVPARVFKAHKGDVHGLTWSADERFLLSSDSKGGVHLWDARNTSARLGRARHDGPVKALAWCPWKPDLFASAGADGDGIIRVWSSSSFGADPHGQRAVPDPLKEISTDSDIFALIWSPHCRELLSTHGRSWGDPEPAPVPGSGTESMGYTNALVVHSYPTGRRIVSLTAHTGPTSQACLSPDGTSVFTICAREEAMKMWRVWSTPVDGPREERTFDRFTIR
ncbi:unnamed protein product [Peniophora sp. CBMAI 1063]|nr:unnamed protein product [Peniophora sp. CBMAI 1063]